MELIRGASIVSGQRRRCAEEAPGDLAESGGTRRHSSRKVNASSLRQTKGGHEEYVLLHRWKRAEHRETESSSPLACREHIPNIIKISLMAGLSCFVSTKYPKGDVVNDTDI